MKKISFEEWSSHYYDVPFIKENYELLESMEVPIECIDPSINCKHIDTIIPSQETTPTKYIRVFTFGSWHEILENGDSYFMHPYLGEKEYDYIGKDEKEIEKNLKDLFEYVTFKCKLNTNFSKNNLFN
tara:strand:+ start:968 stop:1351 length:384 start_codon:yes stop_codon:yes gene_type:complete